MPDSVHTAERSGPLHCGQSDPKSCREQKKTRAKYFATVIVAGFNLRGGTSFVVPRFAIGGKENRSLEDSSMKATHKAGRIEEGNSTPAVSEPAALSVKRKGRGCTRRSLTAPTRACTRELRSFPERRRRG